MFLYIYIIIYIYFYIFICLYIYIVIYSYFYICIRCVSTFVTFVFVISFQKYFEKSILSKELIHKYSYESSMCIDI